MNNPEFIRADELLPAGPTSSLVDNYFRWFTHDSCAGPILQSNWLIKSFLPANGLGVVFGKAGCGKSSVVLDICMQIAVGLLWRNLKVQQCSVTYIASEAGRMGVNRVYAWLRHHERQWPESFRLSPVTLDLRSKDDDVRRLIADIRMNQPQCRLIVIDTLNRNFAGGNENAAEDMSAFIRHCDVLAKETSAFVLIVHHSGKDEGRGSRGHSSLLGALDFEAEVKREQGQPGVVTVTKLRDGVDGKQFGFDIVSQTLGLDEDDEPVTAPVAISADVLNTKARANYLPKGRNQKKVFEAFAQFVLDYGRPNPEGTGFPDVGTVRVVGDEDFRKFAAGKMGRDPKSAAKAVREALNAMEGRRMFCRNEGLLWKL
jgi:hypothetical protein